MRPALTSDPLPPQHPKLAGLLALWTEKAAGRAMPARGDLTPFDLKPWLGHLNLVECIERGQDVRFRVHGSNLVSITGHDMTGKLASEGQGAHWAVILAEYRAAYALGRPFRIAHVIRPDRSGDGWEKLILPLSRTGETIDYFLSGVYPQARQVDGDDLLHARWLAQLRRSAAGA